MSDLIERPVVNLLVTDLDNTLWDWFSIWYQSFQALLDGVVAASGVPRAQFIAEIREVHQRRGTSEYSYLLQELPSLRALHPNQDVASVYDEQLHRFYSIRKRYTQLYQGVDSTLRTIKAAGVPIVAYTESLSFYSSNRIKALGLDGVIDVLYSSPDHDFPMGVTPADIRSRPDSEYELQLTRHRHVPHGVLKPDSRILKEILASMDVSPDKTVYVGDTLMKDVAMAQSVSAIDVLAGYGASTTKEGYDLLREVTHWTAEDVERERQINSARLMTPTYVLNQSFAELLDLFTFEAPGV